MDMQLNIEQLLKSYISEGCRYSISEQFNKLNVIADKILMLDSNNNDGLKFKANSLLELENFDEALSYVNKIIEKDAEDGSVYLLKARILVALNRFNEANECFYSLQELDEYGIEACVEHARVLMELNDYQEALWCCEYAKRNEINGFYFDEDEIKLEIHKRILNDMESNGVFGHEYAFKNIESIDYILINDNFIKLVVPGQDIIFDNNGDKVIRREEVITIGELKERFIDVPGSNFLEWVTEDYELQVHYSLSNKTNIEVIPIHYLNQGDTIVSNYFTSGYEWEYYVYQEGMFEVLYGAYCLGYVLMK